MKSLAVFVFGSLLFAGLSLGAGYGFGGTELVLQGGVALALAFVPAAVTLGWALFTYRSDPSMMLMASLGGSGVRMAVSVGGAYLLSNAYPDELKFPFWCWLVLFYLALLAFEIVILVRQGNQLNGTPKP